MNDNVSESFNQKVVRQLLKGGLERDQKFRLSVTSSSMSPLLKPGDCIFIQKVDPNLLKIGDLIVLNRESNLIIHRFFKVDQEGRYHTKGDNRTLCDPPVSAADILGIVVGIERSQKSFDLTRQKWVRMNRILGMISEWEAKVVDISLQRQTVNQSEKYFREKINQINANKQDKVFILKKMCSRLLRLPFRILTHLVVGISQVLS